MRVAIRSGCGVATLHWALVTAAAAQVRSTDSAGVHVRVYAAEAAPRRIVRVDTAALLRIGESVGGPALVGVQGVAVLGDGRLAVADAAENRLLVIGRDGRLQRTIGRKGTGPGEFDILWRMGRVADTLIAVDASSRIHAFAPDGQLVRAWVRPQLPGAAGANWLGHVHMDTALFVGQPARDQLATGDTLYSRFYLVPTAGPPLVFGEFPSAIQQLIGGRMRQLTLGPAGRVAVGAGRVCTIWTASWAVTCHTARGRALWRTSRNVKAQPLSEQDKDAYRNGFRRANLRVRPPEEVEGWVSRLVFGTQRPVLGRIEIAANGDVWLGEYSVTEAVPFGRPGWGSPDEATRWSVLSKDGVWRADVVLPARFRLAEIGQDFLAGVFRDQDDVETIALLRLPRFE